ncbi:hypothetical protein HR12_08840, partial [Microbacterium sp. SUBG005]
PARIGWRNGSLLAPQESDSDDASVDRPDTTIEPGEQPVDPAGPSDAAPAAGTTPEPGRHHAHGRHLDVVVPRRGCRPRRPRRR